MQISVNIIHYFANIHCNRVLLHKKTGSVFMPTEPVFMGFPQFYAFFFSNAAKENRPNAVKLTITTAAPEGSSNA